MRKRFDEQLEQLHMELIKMGGLCEEAISLSAHALLDGQTELVEQVHLVEESINEKEREIERLCMKLLLQQQPVARDLRNISSALKMISDMERIGDQACDIAELSQYITDSDAQSKVHIGDMAEATVRMVTNSVQAFVSKDLDMAHQVEAADDQVDMLFDQIKEELIGLVHQKGMDAKALLDLLMAAKYFERIGDHAVNLAEWVEYSITGSRDGVAQ